MAALTGAVENGVYTKNDASLEAAAALGNLSSSKTKGSNGTEYNQEMFLQLLVAEMQYQDPLEPTSNTEYVSELASFTQIEAVQSVQEEMKTLEANSLVGQYVILVDDNNEYVSGKVDYVVNDDGELKLAVNDSLYTIDQLDSVVDEKYYNAVLTVEAFVDAMKKLPNEAATTLSDEKAISEARTMFDAMDSYTKGFVSKDTVATLETLEKRIASLKASTEENKAKEDTEVESDSDDDAENQEATV